MNPFLYLGDKMDTIKREKLEAIGWNVSNTNEFLHLTEEDVIIIEQRLKEIAEQGIITASDIRLWNKETTAESRDVDEDEATHLAEIQRMCRECKDNLTCPFAFEKGCI